MSFGLWLPAIVGGAVAGGAPLVLRPILRRRAVFDVPNDRSSHDRPTLRAAGIAQLLGIAAGGLVLFAAGPPDVPLDVMAVILGSGLAASLLGLADDMSPGRGLGVLVRAGVQLLIGAVAAGSLAWLLGWYWAAAGLAAVFVAAYINIANFMDGINGISAMHGAVVGVTQFAVGSVAGIAWLQTLGLLVALVFVVFLPWNVLGAGMFLGDVGSYLLGAVVGAGVVGAAFSDVPVVVALSPISIYLADTLVTLVRRLLRGESVLRAHRTHAYQRLTDTGLTHLRAAALVTAFSAGTATVGLLVAAADLNPLLGGALIVLICTGYLAVPRLRGSRLAPRTPMELAGIEMPLPAPPREGFRPTRWLVLGASGFVGGSLAAHLETQGLHVTRVPGPRVLVPPLDDPHQVVTLARSSGYLEALAGALDGAEVIVNAAGLATPDAPADEALYGANALLPALVAAAADSVGVPRVIHLSSAAVQGRRSRLDESLDVSPFSPYSHSKALGERAFLTTGRPGGATDFVVIRATSVQGRGRRTTESFRRIAQSPLASVAAPGAQPTVVSSIDGLVDFIQRVGESTDRLGPIMLQPWEGYSVKDVLVAAGGRPLVLPHWLCATVLSIARIAGRFVPEVAGLGRRLEMMWLGQGQDSASGRAFPAVSREHLELVLSPTDGGS